MLLDGSVVSLRDGTSRWVEGENASLGLPKSQLSRESFQFVVLRKGNDVCKFEGVHGEDAMFELSPIVLNHQHCPQQFLSQHFSQKAKIIRHGGIEMGQQQD
jgi:hypothetical protein